MYPVGRGLQATLRVQPKSETVNIEWSPLGGQVQVETVWIYDWFLPVRVGRTLGEGVAEVMALHVQVGEGGCEDGGIRSLGPEVSVV